MMASWTSLVPKRSCMVCVTTRLAPRGSWFFLANHRATRADQVWFVDGKMSSKIGWLGMACSLPRRMHVPNQQGSSDPTRTRPAYAFKCAASLRPTGRENLHAYCAFTTNVRKRYACPTRDIVPLSRELI